MIPTFPTFTMKRLSLLLGSLGGVMAGYVFSNKKLRNELADAKDATAAARILGKHLSSDGGQVAKEVKQFVTSQDWEKNLHSGKKYAAKYYKTSKKGVEKMMKVGKKEAKKFMKKKPGAMTDK